MMFNPYILIDICNAREGFSLEKGFMGDNASENGAWNIFGASVLK